MIKRSCFWKLIVIVTVLLTLMVITGCSLSAPRQTTVEIGDVAGGDSSTDSIDTDKSPDSVNNDSSADTAEVDSSADAEETNPSYVPDGNMLRSNTEGAVTIDVEYLGYMDNLVSFNIAMNTHSVDLDQYDLVKLSDLMDDKGNKYTPFSWDSEPGGHHRSGILVFSNPGSQAEPDTLLLIIRNIAEIQERTFNWENISFNS